jgi:hypothetical protein
MFSLDTTAKPSTLLTRIGVMVVLYFSSLYIVTQKLLLYNKYKAERLYIGILLINGNVQFYYNTYRYYFS